MRKWLAALLAMSTSCAVLSVPAIAGPGDDAGMDFQGKVQNAQLALELHSRAAHFGSTNTSNGNDTTYVGYNPAYAASNYWSIGVGERHPRGTLAPPANAARGYWDWEAPVHGDSLQGWWPVRHQYTGTGGLTLPDDQRPWWAIDIGNQISYVINQGPGLRRTFGVTSAWHVDPGNTVTPVKSMQLDAADHNPSQVGWAPLSGTRSAWCGLRTHGDSTEVDAVTGNPYSVDAWEHQAPGGTGATGTNRKYPGYASQWDQMLYRDIDVTSNFDTLKVAFKLRTRMSEGKGSANATRTGWFDKDPLSLAPDNFIASSNNAAAPIDSFMVYVGCSVGDTASAEWLGSDGQTHQVFDPVRRWFGELIRANEPGRHHELFTTYGDRDTVVSAAIPRSALSGWGNFARLVFRVKTNRGFDDDNGGLIGQYSSEGMGAAQIDSVSVDAGAGPVLIGDFEHESDIDNRTTVPPEDAWKTSSKPPAIVHHFHSLSTLLYQDLCGAPGSIARICNMWGNVISMGDHDLSEAANGEFGTAEQERYDGMYSPTINLAANANNTSLNNMGLNNPDAHPTEDFYIAYEVYTGYFDLFNLGAGWQFLFQSYPATQQGGNNIPGPGTGNRQWGEFRLPPFQYFNPDKQCFDNLDAAKAWGCIRTSNPGLQPDSLRIGLRKLGQCYRFGITTDCGSTDGGYWDNVALALIDGAAAQPVSVDIWEWFNDTFPASEDAGLPGLAAFDTTTALIKTGRNDAQQTADLTRYDVPSDSMLITAAGDSMEVELVFRILPGPGNYVVAGDPATGLRKVATDPTPIDASDSTFWTLYILNSGAHGSPGGHPAGTHKTRWSSLVWNSARCDTAEANLFPVAARNVNNSIDAGLFASIYHELDPKHNLLGLSRHRCFMNDTAGAVTDITCSSEPAWVTTVPGTRTGYDGNPYTKEGTKILPDGLLTPGSHVEYFVRRHDLGTTSVYLCPDTTRVYPQPCEGPSLDGHRWQEFSVLPDAWKFSTYGGLGGACMLYVDQNDRRGNERVWVSAADSTCATGSNKYGAHNGWHAANGVDVNNPVGFVYDKNAQPGTTWDMYGIKASESLNTSSGSLGARFAYRGTPSLLDDRWAKNAPTITMLEAYYRVLMILTGDLNSAILGPFNDKSQDDERIIREFLLGAGVGAHRGIFIQGDGFVEATDGSALLPLLGVAFRHPSYLQLSGNINPCPDLVTTSAITTTGDLYGVRTTCTFTNDVLDLDGPDAAAATYYDPVGANPFLAPYISGVFKDAIAPNYWQSLVDGWNIFNLRSRYCGQTNGRLAYVLNVFTNIFSKICVNYGSPCGLTDVPNADPQALADYMNLRNNPLITGQSTLAFGLAKADRVEAKIFDISGRLVRTLSDRRFPPGEYRLVWDGLDDHGHEVGRGVYFARLRYREGGFTSAKKMMVLK